MDAPRVLGKIAGRERGPTLLVVAGIHGNEPAGVHAAGRVLATILQEGRERWMRGDLVVLAGNRGALARGERFRERDLNRGWSEVQVRALRKRAHSEPLAAEDLEQLELLTEIDAAIEAARGPLHFVDLHTTSAAGVPFLMSISQEPSRGFARPVPLPTILGLLDLVDGVLLRFLAARGFATLGVEGGQNADPRSIEHHEAVLWLALVAAGVLPIGRVPEHPRAWAILENARGPLPQAMRVSYRHAIVPEDQFRMEPGFANIQRVERGQLLAHDVRGEIRAGADGLLMLPLYQARGDDGFFLGLEVVD